MRKGSFALERPLALPVSRGLHSSGQRTRQQNYVLHKRDFERPQARKAVDRASLLDASPGPDELVAELMHPPRLP